jgi:hypothetical protein
VPVSRKPNIYQIVERYHPIRKRQTRTLQAQATVGTPPRHNAISAVRGTGGSAPIGGSTLLERLACPVATDRSAIFGS